MFSQNPEALRRTSLVDVPKKHGEQDQLSIEKYENALAKLIMGAHTPLTIALQGEWGSGKTSLMNSLRHRLTDTNSEDGFFSSVWVNTWEFSLSGAPEDAILRILNSIIRQIGETDPSDKVIGQKVADVLGKIKSWLAISARFGVSVFGKQVGGFDDLGGYQMKREKSDNDIDETSESGISKAKTLLAEIITQSLHNSRPVKRGFLFFIDDLDRIEPTVAVQILELLKNIFDLEKCIFILAIDYDVVIKGLKPKYGEKTAANEREFRSFFDKIIQLPFVMPVAKYGIGEFLINSLRSINFLTDNEAKYAELKAMLTRSAMWTIGNNPRSLKRLVNILSLIQMLDDDKNADAENPALKAFEKFMDFSLVCIQISFPAIYSYLSVMPDFEKWDSNFLKQLNLDDITEQERDLLSGFKEKAFDEAWEHALYAMCQVDPHLKSKAWNLSYVLNAIRDSIPQGDSLEEHMRRALGSSSVTHVKSQNPVKEEETMTFHPSTELKKINLLILTNVNSLLQDAGKAKIRQVSGRIQLSLKYQSDLPQDKDGKNGWWWDMGRVSLRAEGSGVCLILSSGDWLFGEPLTTRDYDKELSLRGLTKDQFQAFETRFKELPKRHPKLMNTHVDVSEPHAKIGEGKVVFERGETYTFSKRPLSSIISDEFMTEFAKFHFDLIQIRRDMNSACSAERAIDQP